MTALTETVWTMLCIFYTFCKIIFMFMIILNLALWFVDMEPVRKFFLKHRIIADIVGVIAVIGFLMFLFELFVTRMS